MNNTIIISLTIFFFLVLIISLYFLFKKKELIVEEMQEMDSISNEIEEIELEKDLKINENILAVVEEIEKKDKVVTTDIKSVEVKKDVVSESDDSKLNINIASKTEKILLKKLENFEISKGFLKKEVNLNYLAKEFDTNTKYLSEIIKSYKNKNFNQYLNELRIDYLIDQLRTNEKVLNTKVSYLASDFGFNSHSSFSTVFTQYIGETPSEFIKKLKHK